jgi:hypothetical protein
MRGEVKDGPAEEQQRALKEHRSPIPSFPLVDEIPASEEAGYSNSFFKAMAML